MSNIFFTFLFEVDTILFSEDATCVEFPSGKAISANLYIDVCSTLVELFYTKNLYTSVIEVIAKKKGVKNVLVARHFCQVWILKGL